MLLVEASTEPYFGKKSFTCPHCGANCQQSWARCEARDEDSEDAFDPYLNVSTCFVCNAEAVWLRERFARSSWGGDSGQIIYPTAQRGGPPRSSDMPEAVASIYDEASTVVGLSPRSASALLRLALEALLEDLYSDNKGNLNAMIGAAVKDGMPQGVQQTMDYMRFSGNQSVHELHHDDTLETATTLFNLLNFVVERLITQPRQLEGLYGGLPHTFKEQVQKRDTP